ncbi:Flp pilus assembly complex ATPase component TadA [Myxococcota bacterium]|nr:Flp pilus assembly complex ATPase component TadA [Myxococcota bacterium]
MSEDRRLGNILVARGQLGPGELEAALRLQREQRRADKLGPLLVELGMCDDVDVAQAIAQQTGLPYVDPVAEPIEAGLVWRLPREMAELHRAVPLHRVHSGDGPVPKGAPVRVAMADPRNMAALSEFQFILGAPIQVCVAAPSRISLAVHRHYDLEPMARRLLDSVPEQLRTPPPPRAQRELGRVGGPRLPGAEDEGQAFIQLLDFIFAQAIQRGASDVHFSPTPDGLRVRYRIDGMLRDVLQLPSWATAALTSRIKVVAGLSVYEHRRPQDGSLAVVHEDRQIDLRISTMPGQFGETTVVRLLDPRMLQVDLGSLGWDRKALARWYRLVSQNQGLVLVVGPTGSGKSTTLYATINRLRSEATHIVTLEDPVEYRVPGISQIQVHAQIGMTFAAGIRSLLRQDPDIMVVGEIRDPESAEAAVEAANTGHLVLSTVHTGHAVDAITRMIDLGVAPFLLGSALLGVVAQRLVRRVCPECSVLAPPVEEDWLRVGIAPVDLGDQVRRVGDGCPACEYVGYKGRVGVFEVMRVDEELRDALHERATDRQLWAIARKAGLRTLLEDALDKVAAGQTTLEELARVVPPDRWERRAIQSTGWRLSGTEADEPPGPPPARTTPPAVQAEEDTLHDAAADAGADRGEEDTADAVSEPHARPTVLVVDDHEEILQLVGISLEDHYAVRFARDGEEALAAVAALRPDALILDVMMPKLSGYEVCERLKGDPATAALPVLILSARGDTAHVKQGFHSGADDYLPKPFDPEELELRVRALLRRSGRLGTAAPSGG